MHGNFFEDLTVGRRFRHPTPRTLTSGDVALYIGLTGARQPLACSRILAQRMGHVDCPIDDLLVFNIVFGKTVPDISRNAVANLGYADVRFLAAVRVGDTIRAESEVIGRRETARGDAGIVYVRTQAFDQDETPVCSFVRWVMVRKAATGGEPCEAQVPHLPTMVEPDRIVPPPPVDGAALFDASQSDRGWEDYAVGERIDHPDGITIDPSDHTLATKLFQNNAQVHFDALLMSGTGHGQRLVYGGFVMSICHALGYDGLENAFAIGAINGGTHAAPVFAGDTLYAATLILDRFALPGRSDVGAIRIRRIGLKNVRPEGLDLASLSPRERHPALVLDLDHTLLFPSSSLLRNEPRR
ncbi:MaoC family dehydratase [Sphingomonas profundi]|uniref:MaoC family dehydratase n=1 Tax=Alterirhizorhabdus profundi TaxID=2681549 RepID=UPI0012E8B2F1|nr:MaoC family dehydratase [Sphingomonas profundi]